MKKFLLILLCTFLMCGCSVKKEEIDTYQYYYTKCNPNEKKAYKKILEGMIKQKDEIVLEDMSIYNMFDLYNYVTDDHPELFWVEQSYTYEEYEDYVIMYPEYSMNLEEVKSIQTLIDENVSVILKNIDTSKNTHEIIKQVFDYVVENTEYKDEAENDQNIQSVFITHQSVCAGYVRAMQYLLIKLGIDCTLIDVNDYEDPNAEIGHCLIMADVDGNYLYYDPTWADEVEDIHHTCYAFFSLTHEDLLKNYVPKRHYEETKDVKATYFYEKNLVLSKWDERWIVERWKEAKNENKKHIEIKCENEEIYQDVYARIKNTQALFPLLKEAGIYASTYYFIQHEEMNLIDVFYE